LQTKTEGWSRYYELSEAKCYFLIKFLDKFYNKVDLPWVNLIWHAHYDGKVPHAENLCSSFRWHDVLKLVDNFRGVAIVQHGSGNTFLF
jgi:hypothetical protein